MGALFEMPWRSNVGQPLQLKSNSPGSEEASHPEFVQGDEVLNNSGAGSGNPDIISSQDVDEYLNSALNESAFEQHFNDFDTEALQSDIISWNNRPVESSDIRTAGFDWDFSEADFSDEPVLSGSAFSRIISNAVACNTSVECPALPWERPPFNEIFGVGSQNARRNFIPISNAGLESFAHIDEIPEMVASAAVVQVRPDDISSKVISNVADISYERKFQELVEQAVGKWLDILKLHSLPSEVGQQILATCNVEKSATAKEIVKSVLGVRSPNTAVTRANSLLKYLRWTAEKLPGHSPLQEECAWRYLQFLQKSGGAATTGSSFMSSLRYAKHVFGYSCFDEMIGSRRVLGACDILYTSKRALKQALVLSVSQMLELHRFLEDASRDKADRAFVAYIITAIYSRCRHSDLRRVRCVNHDWDQKSGFVEILTNTHKTGRTAKLKTQLLPIVAPAFGVNGKLWPNLVEEAFNNVGLSFRGELHGPLYRPASFDGVPCIRGISSDECTRFLQVFFGVDGTTSKDESCISSHSLKATCLSWASKHGMDPSDKSILGRHSDSVAGSSAIYSRDLVVRSIMKLQDIIWDIFHGRFVPDSSRRGYFAEPSEQQPVAPADGFVQVKEEKGEKQVENVVASSDEEHPRDEVEDGDSSSSDSSCSSSSESVQQPVERPLKIVKASYGILPNAGKAFRHNVSKIVHFCSKATLEDDWTFKTFSCGRSLGKMHQEAGRFDLSNMCRLCKQKASEENALDG